MFQHEDRKALQSLIDSGVVTAEQMSKPKAALDAIGSTIKSEEHFWAQRDELMSDLQQLPHEGIYALSQHICDLITKSKFAQAPTVEMVKIMVLQHAVKYHETRDWIRQQNQPQVTYQALLSHCEMLEAPCKQYQKAKERSHADVASITAVTSSLHLDAISKSKPCCYNCGYSHPNGKCPAKGQQCYACGGYNHYTVLCQHKGCRQNKKQQRGFKPSKCSYSHGCHSSCSLHRHHCRNHSSCSHSRTPSHSPLHIPTHGASTRHSSHFKMCSTPHRYYQDAIDVIPADSITTGNWAEGKLYTERASDVQVAFFTCLNLPAQSGTKTMVVKMDPGAQVNTIPLNRYCTLYPNKLNKSRYPKAKSPMPTHHTWISHNGLPKPFLGHFIVEVVHAKEPRTYPVRFYVFEDATNPHILLSFIIRLHYRGGYSFFSGPQFGSHTLTWPSSNPQPPSVARGRPQRKWPFRTLSAWQGGPIQAATPK